MQGWRSSNDGGVDCKGLGRLRSRTRTSGSLRLIPPFTAGEITLSAASHDRPTPRRYWPGSRNSSSTPHRMPAAVQLWINKRGAIRWTFPDSRIAAVVQTFVLRIIQSISRFVGGRKFGSRFRSTLRVFSTLRSINWGWRLAESWGIREWWWSRHDFFVRARGDSTDQGRHQKRLIGLSTR